MVKLLKAVIAIIVLLLLVVIYVQYYAEPKTHKNRVDDAIAQAEKPSEGNGDIQQEDTVSKGNVEKHEVNGQVMDRTDAYARLVGVIRNDRIKLKEPIYKGASEVNMRKGVATLNVDDDLNQDLLAISGHRAPWTGTYFSDVLKLKEGEIIYIDHYGANGKETEVKYKVKRTYLLDPTQREDLEKDVSVKTLQLITCDAWDSERKEYMKRYITEAEIVE